LWHFCSREFDESSCHLYYSTSRASQADFFVIIYTSVIKTLMSITCYRCGWKFLFTTTKNSVKRNPFWRLDYSLNLFSMALGFCKKYEILFWIGITHVWPLHDYKYIYLKVVNEKLYRSEAMTITLQQYSNNVKYQQCHEDRNDLTAYDNHAQNVPRNVSSDQTESQRREYELCKNAFQSQIS